MRYKLQHRIPAVQMFGRFADPKRETVWKTIAQSDDRQFLEDQKAKITEGDRRAERQYRIVDEEERNDVWRR